MNEKKTNIETEKKNNRTEMTQKSKSNAILRILEMIFFEMVTTMMNVQKVSRFERKLEKQYTRSRQYMIFRIRELLVGRMIAFDFKRGRSVWCVCRIDNALDSTKSPIILKYFNVPLGIAQNPL